MNREIKFRGKSNKENKWVYGDFLHQDKFNRPTIKQDNYTTCIKEDTIGQYTGLKDKNGKEIYEGDILKFKMYDGKYENYKIVFRNAEFEAINEDDTNFISTDIWNVYGEVIGNIYDNPELLEV